MIKILVKARFAAMLAALTPKRKNGDPAKKAGKGMLALMIFLYLYLGGVFMMMFFVSSLVYPSQQHLMFGLAFFVRNENV